MLAGQGRLWGPVALLQAAAAQRDKESSDDGLQESNRSDTDRSGDDACSEQGKSSNIDHDT